MLLLYDSLNEIRDYSKSRRRLHSAKKSQIQIMNTGKYTDKEIVDAILNRDPLVTKEFLYRKCYPLFSSIYNKYYTDCNSPIELINQIYLYILSPHKKTHRSKLQDFGFRCSLMMWIKIVTENYCHQLFARRLVKTEILQDRDDRNMFENYSIESSINKMAIQDVRKILQSMPNERYRKLIELHYLDGMANEETAMLLGLTMSNYYNVHLRAKTQFYAVLKQEGLI